MEATKLVINGTEVDIKDAGAARTSHTHTTSEIQNFPTIPSTLSALTDDSTHRLVTDTEKAAWNGKQSATDSSLNTTSKTVSGAINELLSDMITVSGVANTAASGVATLTVTVANKKNVPSAHNIADGTTVTISDNSEYRGTNISAIEFVYPEGNFECWIRFSTATTGTVSVVFPEGMCIGAPPDFSANGKTFEVSIKDGIMVAAEVGDTI